MADNDCPHLSSTQIGELALCDDCFENLPLLTDAERDAAIEVRIEPHHDID